MTAEREAMTERQAFEHAFASGDVDHDAHTFRQFHDGSYYDDRVQDKWEGWQAATANLSRAAEPVGWVWMSGDQLIFGREKPVIGGHAAQPVYTHPPEPARDATRWRKVRRMGVFKPGNPSDCKFVFNDEADAVVDAAMAQESDNG